MAGRPAGRPFPLETSFLACKVDRQLARYFQSWIWAGDYLSWELAEFGGDPNKDTGSIFSFFHWLAYAPLLEAWLGGPGVKGGGGRRDLG